MKYAVLKNEVRRNIHRLSYTTKISSISSESYLPLSSELFFSIIYIYTYHNIFNFYFYSMYPPLKKFNNQLRDDILSHNEDISRLGCKISLFWWFCHTLMILSQMNYVQLWKYDSLRMCQGSYY